MSCDESWSESIEFLLEQVGVCLSDVLEQCLCFGVLGRCQAEFKLFMSYSLLGREGTDDIIGQSVNSLVANLWDFQTSLDFLAVTILSSPGSFNFKVVDGQ